MERLNEIRTDGLNEACRLQYENTRLKDFPELTIPSELMLVVTELSEAVQADRKEGMTNIRKFIHQFFETNDEEYRKQIYENYIKDTVQMEVTDAIMRLMSFCGEYDIDVENLIWIKTFINSKRPQRNGKRY